MLKVAARGTTGRTLAVIPMRCSEAPSGAALPYHGTSGTPGVRLAQPERRGLLGASDNVGPTGGQA
jgi:hypothetical protein